MAEQTSKSEADEAPIVLPYSLAKMAGKWITNLLAIIGALLSAYIAVNRDAGEHPSKHTSADDTERIERLEKERNDAQAEIVKLTGDWRACQQHVDDSERFRVAPSRRR